MKNSPLFPCTLIAYAKETQSAPRLSSLERGSSKTRRFDDILLVANGNLGRSLLYFSLFLHVRFFSRRNERMPKSVHGARDAAGSTAPRAKDARNFERNFETGESTYERIRSVLIVIDPVKLHRWKSDGSRGVERTACQVAIHGAIHQGWNQREIPYDGFLHRTISPRFAPRTSTFFFYYSRSMQIANAPREHKDRQRARAVKFIAELNPRGQTTSL